MNSNRFKDHIDYLGQLLDSIIEKHEDEAVLTHIRQILAATTQNDSAALSAHLQKLPRDEALKVIRGFSFFCNFPTLPKTNTTFAAAARTR